MHNEVGTCAEILPVIFVHTAIFRVSSANLTDDANYGGQQKMMISGQCA